MTRCPRVGQDLEMPDLDLEKNDDKKKKKDQASGKRGKRGRKPKAEPAKEADSGGGGEAKGKKKKKSHSPSKGPPKGGRIGLNLEAFADVELRCLLGVPSHFFLPMSVRFFDSFAALFVSSAATLQE